MAGREGLVDTAVKTAETGYMSRRLMKALEDLSLLYDGTVRNSMGGIVQLRSGGDGMEPTMMESENAQPIEFERCLMNVRSHHPSRGEASATRSAVNTALDEFKRKNKIFEQLAAQRGVTATRPAASLRRGHLQALLRIHERIHHE